MARKGFPQKPEDVVALSDLAPRRQVIGGSERRVFGAESGLSEEQTRKSKRDLPPRKEAKGGKLAGNDSVTLVRGAKTKKDLSPRKETKGGRLVANDSPTLVRSVKIAKKDLPPRKTTKGGKGLIRNDNLTLVRL